MATIAPYTFLQFFDDNGDPLGGGKVETYEAGTSTPTVTYTDATEDTANANPVILDSSGRAQIWLGAGNFKFVLRDSNDVLIKEVDAIAGQSTGGIVSYDLSSNTAITENYANANIYVTGSTTLSLLPVADATDGFTFWVYNNGTDTVTIDPDATETINGNSTFTMQPKTSVRISGDGSMWYAYISGGVRVSSNDETGGYLNGKLIAGNAVTFTENNDGGDETLNIDVDAATETSEGVVEAATQTEMNNGTADKFPDADKVKTYVDNASPFESAPFTPAEISITAAAGGSLAHGFAGVPKFVTLRLRCAVADAGHSVNDYITISADNRVNSSQGVSISSDTTNINYRFGSGASGNVFYYFNKSTGTAQNLTNSSWRLVIIGWY